MLSEGSQHQQEVPDPGHLAYFYFYPAVDQVIDVIVSCPGYHINIYANLEEIDFSAKTELDYPTEEKKKYFSLNEKTENLGFNQLSIPKIHDGEN